MWEVDDNAGLQKIDNPDTARAIISKVNALNLQTAFQTGLPVALFALLPQSVSAPLVGCAVVFGALYLGRDQIAKLEP